MNIKNMKYRVVLLLTGLFFALFVEAQSVGVNTNFPLGRLHIDSKGDNTAATTVNSVETADDILINTQGHLGIGTANPTNKLHVRGLMKIVDGKQGNFKLFSSINTNGFGEWTDPNNILNPTAIWRVSSSGMNIVAGVNYFPASATVTIDDRGIGVFKNNQKLKIPKGNYIVIADGEIENVSENVNIKLFSGAITNSLWGADYYEKLSGSSFMLSFSTLTEIEFQIGGTTPPNRTSYPYFTWAPFNNVSVWYELMLIKVS